MQDNRKYIDRGWQQMSVLLDKEMPQLTRRRYKATWWLIAAGILLVIAGWSYYSIQQDKKEQIPLPSSAIAVNKTTVDGQEAGQVSAMGSTIGTVSKIESESTDAEIKTIQHSQSSLTPASHSAQSVSAEVSKQDIAASSSPVLSSETTVPEARNKDQLLPVSPVANQPIVGSSVEVAKTEIGLQTAETGSGTLVNPETEQDMISQTEVARAQIHVLSLATLTPEFTAKSNRGLPIQVARPDKHHPVGLEAIASTHLNADGNPLYGVEAGLSAVIRADKKLRIHAGATYGYYNIDGLSILGLEKNADQEYLGSGGPLSGAYTVQDVYANNLEFTEARELTEKFHYIHVPVKVEYRVTPRFSVAAGVKLSALLAAPARFGLNDERFNSSPVVPTSSSRGFLYDYDILHKMDIAPLLSISYKIAQRLWLDAGYSHGLVHYINNGQSGLSSGDNVNRNDFHRSASLGVRYRLL